MEMYVDAPSHQHMMAASFDRPNANRFRVRLMAENRNIRTSCISRTHQNIGGGNTGILTLTSSPSPSPKPNRASSRGRSRTTRPAAEYPAGEKGESGSPSRSSASHCQPATTSNSISDHPDTNPNDDLLTFETHATNGPSACSASEPAPNIDPLSPYTDHQSDNRPHHVSFDPKARIIPNPDEGNSSDEENHTRRSRSHTRKRPVRLCTKKIALPLNRSTSSLIGIGHHNNLSNASLSSITSPGPVSARELIAQTRKEIDEDEQFIPDAPRFVNLTLPSITRQPDRRALRLEEEHRLERWRQMGGRDKSNLKPTNYSNLSHLSSGLRERLTSATAPVQLSTNTAINSIPSSVSSEDVLKQITQDLPPSKQLRSVNSNALLAKSEPHDHKKSEQIHPLSPPVPVANSPSDDRPAPHVASAAKQGAASETLSPSQKIGRKSSRFRWLGQKVRSIRANRQRAHSLDPGNSNAIPSGESTHDAPGALLEKSPTPAWSLQSPHHMSPDKSLEGASLKRVSTPRVTPSQTIKSGAPLKRTSTPGTSIQSPSGPSLQRTSTPGAPPEKTSTPGPTLQRSATTGSLLIKPKHANFFRKLGIWRKKPPSSNQKESITDPAVASVDDVIVISAPPLSSPIQSMSNLSLALETNDDTRTTSANDKWGSSREIPLRECCSVCLDSANVGVGAKDETEFTPGALQHHHKKSWILQDTLKQGGIPSQQIKLISEELGAPYTTFVAHNPNT
ncbi:hypothetical protein MJO28_007869 [Puccinia striiformis f. sp. tritici]|uniref:Uncharacterized protein n=1 Tax=Puccinia striiformis f. sp. tritici TaxID=168172 RepID=A0ACC0EFN3_9BASI|nr:hypothetical protein MJO28_007869 [Puccinia striiformis f. sp. tritici]